MFMGIQILPVVYVDNLTNQTIENLGFTFEGIQGKLPTIKKIKSGERKSVSIYNKGYLGKRMLYLTYVNKKVRITENQEIFAELTDSFVGNILVEIKGIKKDGRFEVNINNNFDLKV
ncbi:hypothetical protein ACQKP0_13150 [Heyndrickxia sp. NPDC080065]|uniref:hypothetical protein n=1 Tax=Heyndrickxia sp. NPDC080065 TaxID=3390568 RepID=UPI003CFE1A85